MKYSLIFAATAAAYDAYGYNASDKPTPSVAKPSCYTTITPGYGKDPVTITKQHQAYPTCVSKGYGDKSCDKWGEDTYVSTTIKDYNGKDTVITKTNDKVTVYYEKKTITHTETGKYGAKSTPVDNKYPAPTGSYNSKDYTDDKGCWYELYEKVETAEYGKLGVHALKGYPGSGLCKASDNEQEVYVKEYKDGKWGNEVKATHVYGKPKAEVTSYGKPGVYTIPSKDKTVDSTMYYPAEATKTAKAGETCTYGGQYIDAKETGYITAGYAAYETSVYGDKTSTSTVLKYTTIYVSTTGKVEVYKPTVTVYDKDTTYAYPTASYYNPGVYHQEAKTVTVTKANEVYTCEYEQTKKYEPTPMKGDDYSYPTATPKYDDSYGYKPSATPYKPTEGDKEYPAYPAPYNSTNNYNSYPAYGAEPTPKKPASDYPSYPAATPVYGDKPYDSKDYPVKPVSTPCDDDKKAYPTGKPAGYEPPKPAAYEPSKPAGYEPSKPAAYESSKPAAYEPSKPAGYEPPKPAAYESSKPAAYEPSYPTPTPVYGDSYPTPTPVYGDSYPTPTPVYGDSYPTPTPVYGDSYATPTPVKPAGYGKRDSIMARRARAL
jgi:hypothetical protein